MKTRSLITIIVIIIFNINIYSQQNHAISIFNEVFASSGTYSEVSLLCSLAWTVGEPIVTTEQSDNLILTQGFHQPNTGYLPEEPVIIDRKGNDNILIEYSRFDDGRIRISINSNYPTGKQAFLNICNILGQILVKEYITIETNKNYFDFNLSNYARGIYLINIYETDMYKPNSNKLLKFSYRIIKE